MTCDHTLRALGKTSFTLLDLVDQLQPVGPRQEPAAIVTLSPDLWDKARLAVGESYGTAVVGSVPADNVAQLRGAPWPLRTQHWFEYGMIRYVRGER